MLVESDSVPQKPVPDNNSRRPSPTMATNNNKMNAQDAGNNMQRRWEGLLLRVFDLLDYDGGEIRGTCFNAVVDRFYEIIEVGKVYLISEGSLKPPQTNFNRLINGWEILLEASSTVDFCPDEDGSIL
ncbi:Rpa1ap [Sarracenia purpurea var. burkii]